MKASFFDWDGTLTNRKIFLMNEFYKHIASRNLAPMESYYRMEGLKRLYAEKKISYREAAGDIPLIYATSLKGVKQSDINRESKSFAQEVMRKYLYPYAKGLVSLMHDRGLTISISGAPHGPIKSLGKILDFDLSYGTLVEIEDGVCTGKLKQNLVIKETKEAVIAKIIKEKDIDLEESYAFGDTGQDLPLLSRVGHPVCLNPNSVLLEIAQKNNWPIFTSKDDVVSNIKKLLK
jgi:HAD superfamily hydrolase (TIGR01490 family)